MCEPEGIPEHGTLRLLARTCFLRTPNGASRDHMARTFAARGSRHRQGSIPKTCFPLDVKASSRYIAIQRQLRGDVSREDIADTCSILYDGAF